MPRKIVIREKCDIKPSPESKGNSYDVHFNNLTRGEAMAILHALELYKEQSIVARDAHAYMVNADYRAGKPIAGDF